MSSVLEISAKNGQAGLRNKRTANGRRPTERKGSVKEEAGQMSWWHGGSRVLRGRIEDGSENELPRVDTFWARIRCRVWLAQGAAKGGDNYIDQGPSGLRNGMQRAGKWLTRCSFEGPGFDPQPLWGAAQSLQLQWILHLLLAFLEIPLTDTQINILQKNCDV